MDLHSVYALEYISFLHDSSYGSYHIASHIKDKNVVAFGINHSIL
jgi:hypothetical protein